MFATVSMLTYHPVFIKDMFKRYKYSNEINMIHRNTLNN